MGGGSNDCLLLNKRHLLICLLEIDHGKRLARLNLKIGVAASERKERKARPMDAENEGHKNGGWGNLQSPFSLCPLRSLAALQFRSSGLNRALERANPVPSQRGYSF